MTRWLNFCAGCCVVVPSWDFHCRSPSSFLLTCQALSGSMISVMESRSSPHRSADSIYITSSVLISIDLNPGLRTAHPDMSTWS